MIRRLRLHVKARIRKWKSDRFLKKHHVETYEMYHIVYDKNRNNRADTLDTYYHGYPYFVVFESSRGDPWTRYPTWIEGYDAIQSWCKENCKDKWRSDIHRVMRAPSTAYQWELNDIGGGDALFFAFKSQEDCFIFKLKWGGE